MLARVCAERERVVGVITSYCIHYTKLYDLFLQSEALAAPFAPPPPWEERFVTGLDREGADPGEDIAAILLVGHERLVDEDLQEQVV